MTKKRLFDIFISILLLIPIIPIGIIIIFLIKITSDGPSIFWSDRIGKNNIVFKMPKFRSMKINTKQTASNLLKNPNEHITLIGHFIRKTSLDELPQIYSILKGQMSLVGPRPALYNQKDLINLRNKNNIDKMVPGLTGWAQVNGRDALSIKKKVEYEKYYMENQSFFFDLKIIILTILVVIKRKGLIH